MGKILMAASGSTAEDKDPFSEVSVTLGSPQDNTDCRSPGKNSSVPAFRDISNDNLDNVSGPEDVSSANLDIPAEHVGDTGQGLRTLWTDEQNEACKKYFTDFFETGVYPSAGRIRYVCSQIPSLRTQTPRKVEAHLQHLKFGRNTGSRRSKARKHLF